jgi:hypothetical protein
VCVKGGENVNVAMIRDMAHVVDREKAKVGIFITLAEATGPMKTEAVKAASMRPASWESPKTANLQDCRSIRRKETANSVRRYGQLQRGSARDN